MYSTTQGKVRLIYLVERHLGFVIQENPTLLFVLSKIAILFKPIPKYTEINVASHRV